MGTITPTVHVVESAIDEPYIHVRIHDTAATITPPDSPLLTTYYDSDKEDFGTIDTPRGSKQKHDGIQVAYNSNIHPHRCVYSYSESKQGIAYQVWESSSILCEYVDSFTVDSPAYWHDKHVIELGAGCATVGILLAALGAHSVCTDQQQVVHHIDKNIECNNQLLAASTGSVRGESCDWFDDQLPPAILPNTHTYDYIVASDCLYWEELFQPFLNTISALLKHSPNAIMYLCQTPRRNKVESKFFKMLRQAHYTCEVVYQCKIGTNRQFTSVYKVIKKM